MLSAEEYFIWWRWSTSSLKFSENFIFEVLLFRVVERSTSNEDINLRIWYENSVLRIYNLAVNSRGRGVLRCVFSLLLFKFGLFWEEDKMCYSNQFLNHGGFQNIKSNPGKKKSELFSPLREARDL